MVPGQGQAAAGHGFQGAGGTGVLADHEGPAACAEGLGVEHAGARAAVEGAGQVGLAPCQALSVAGCTFAVEQFQLELVGVAQLLQQLQAQARPFAPGVAEEVGRRLVEDQPQAGLPVQPAFLGAVQGEGTGGREQTRRFGPVGEDDFALVFVEGAEHVIHQRQQASVFGAAGEAEATTGEVGGELVLQGYTGPGAHVVVHPQLVADEGIGFATEHLVKAFGGAAHSLQVGGGVGVAHLLGVQVLGQHQHALVGQVRRQAGVVAAAEDDRGVVQVGAAVGQPGLAPLVPGDAGQQVDFAGLEAPDGGLDAGKGDFLDAAPDEGADPRQVVVGDAAQHGAAGVLRPLADGPHHRHAHRVLGQAGAQFGELGQVQRWRGAGRGVPARACQQRQQGEQRQRAPLQHSPASWM